MKVLINFANENFAKEQKYNSKTGLKNGGFDRVIEYSSKDVDREFYDKNKEILDNPKGAGLWLWKPYFIKKTLDILNEGDYLFYCDSGSFFINSINHLIESLERDQQELMAFEYSLLNVQFTKPEFIGYFNEDLFPWLYSNQFLGGFLLIKKSEKTLGIIAEYLLFCQRKELIFDPVEEVNNSLFVAHRHDQTVLSYILWKNEITGYRDPSQFGNFRYSYNEYALSKKGISYACYKSYINSPYPTIVILYRKSKLYKWFPRQVFFLKHNLKLRLKEL